MPKPIIPWMGGKTRLADKILPLFPPHTCYVEVFAGGAALFYKKEPSKVEVLNDLNGELINLYRVLQHHLEEFLRQFKWALSSRQVFEWERMKHPETLTDIQRAARFYYLQKQAFGGKVHNPTFGTAATTPPRLNLLRMEEDLSQAHLRLARVTVENLDWAACITRYDRDETLFYLDPPYWETAGYGQTFDLQEYEKMADLMASMKGRAVLSVNDHKEMRRVFKGHRMQPLSITYQVGGAGRSKPSRELVIMNWEGG